MTTNRTIQFTNELRARLKDYNIKELEALFDLNAAALMSFEGVNADRLANALEAISDELHDRKVSKLH